VDVRSIPEILACGPGTLRELRASGLNPVAIPEKNFGASGLLTLAKNKIQRGERVLRVRSDVAGTSLGDALREQGAVVEDVCIYHNEPMAQGELPPFDVVFFASSSAVRAFVDAWGTESLASKTILAIGKPTAGALENAGMTDILVSPEATVGNAIGCLSASAVDRAFRAAVEFVG
jgi:uroporphyrinogen-III synthase